MSRRHHRALLLLGGLLPVAACHPPPSPSEAAVDQADSAETEHTGSAGDSGAPSLPSLEMVDIPGGTYLKGCPSMDHPECGAEAREVTVAAFTIDRYEARAVDYAACVEAGACTPPFAHGRDYAHHRLEEPSWPAGGLSGPQAEDFCAWMGLRLPTSAEWEFAARGPDFDQDHAFGPDFDWALCNGCDSPEPPQEHVEGPDIYDACTGEQDGYPGPAPVDAHPDGASGWGLEQVCGNQFEWTSTTYETSILTAYPTQRAEPGADGELRRVIRGGSWGPNNGIGHPDIGLVVWREFADPEFADNDHMGVRCAGDP